MSDADKAVSAGVDALTFYLSRDANLQSFKRSLQILLDNKGPGGIVTDEDVRMIADRLVDEARQRALDA